MSQYPVMFYAAASGEIVPAGETDQALAWGQSGRLMDWRTMNGEPLEPVGMFSPSQLGYAPFRHACRHAVRRAAEHRQERLRTLRNREAAARSLWASLDTRTTGCATAAERFAVLREVIVYGVPVSRAAKRNRPESAAPETWASDMRRFIHRLRERGLVSQNN